MSLEMWKLSYLGGARKIAISGISQIQIFRIQIM